MKRPEDKHGGRMLIAEIGTSLCIIAIVWKLTSGSTSPFVPSLGLVLERFQAIFLFDKMLSDLSRSVIRLVVTFVVAVGLGVTIGVVLGVSRTARLMSQPVVTYLRSIPPPAMVPVAFVLLGHGDRMIIAIAIFVCLWPIVLNTQDGIAELDRTMMASARAYGLSGKRRLFLIILPAISPRIFAGMRISLTFAFIMVIITEIMAATEGLGYLLTRARNSFNIPDMWASILMIGVMGYMSTILFGMVERRVLRWHRESRRSIE